MKLPSSNVIGRTKLSLPARGVWIEITDFEDDCIQIESLPARGVWIEIVGDGVKKGSMLSLPARGVWIEINLLEQIANHKTVTPRKGSVD